MTSRMKWSRGDLSFWFCYNVHLWEQKRIRDKTARSQLLTYNSCWFSKVFDSIFFQEIRKNINVRLREVPRTGSTLLRTAHLLRTEKFEKIKINCSYGTLSISRNLEGIPFTNFSESLRIRRNLAAARRPKFWELCPFSSRKKNKSTIF